MANAKFIKPQHIGRLFYSYWDGSAWSAHVEITDTFLNDETKSHTGTVSGLASLSDDLVEKDRFIMYYGSYVNGVWTAASGTLDSIAMARLSQTSGLTIKVYADDSIALGSVPTTLIDTHVQVAGSSTYSTKSELIEFTETTKEVFMIEREGIESYNAGSSANLIKNGSFSNAGGAYFDEWTDGGNWSVATSLSAADPGSAAAFAYVDLDTDAAGNSYLYQNVGGTTGSDQDFTIKVNIKDCSSSIGEGIGAIRVGTTANSTTYLGESITNADDGEIVEHTFSLTSGQSLGYVTIGAFNNEATANSELRITFDDIEMYATSGTVYIGSPLDTGALIFGGDAVQPDRNFSNGATFDSSRKYKSSASASRSFMVQENSLRMDAIPYKVLTDTEIIKLETLDKELNNGLCIYQRDSSSTDERDWFIGRLQTAETKGDFTDINSMKCTVTELVERV